MNRTLLALVLFPAVTACSSTLAAVDSAPSVPSAAEGVVIRGTQALILAHLAYQTVATPIAVGLEKGIITGEKKMRLQALDLAVINALRAAGQIQSKAEMARHLASAITSIAEMARLAGVPLPRLAGGSDV